MIRISVLASSHISCLQLGPWSALEYGEYVETKHVLLGIGPLPVVRAESELTDYACCERRDVLAIVKV